MKRLFLLLLFLSTQIYAQLPHMEVKTADGKQFLLGSIPVELMMKEPYKQWFDANYQDYQPEESTLPELKSTLDKYSVLVFLGTWCGDSRREVPRFLKTLDLAEFPEERVKIIALDRREPNIKKSPTGEEWGLQIKRVPTFIFLKDGKEVNRIVESPIETLEKDILKITSQQDYIPNYLELMQSK